jgi:hypothetical protein
LTKGNELNRCVLVVESKTLTRERVVLALSTFVVRSNLQIVGVAGVLLGFQVHEHGLLFTLAVEKEFDILVEIRPNLLLCLFLIALMAS